MAKPGGLVNVAWRVVASGTELRRLLGLPDVLPLCEVRARACERWLVEWLARIDGAAEARRLVGRDAGGAGCEP